MKNVKQGPPPIPSEIVFDNVVAIKELLHNKINNKEAIHLSLTSADTAGFQLLLAAQKAAKLAEVPFQITCDDEDLADLVSTVGLGFCLTQES